MFSSDALHPNAAPGTIEEVAVDEEEQGRHQNGNGVVRLKTGRVAKEGENPKHERISIETSLVS